MVVAHKSLGAIAETTGTSLSVPVPALSVGDYAVMWVWHVGNAPSTPAGWTEAGSVLVDADARVRTYWHYATTSESATSAAITLATAIGLGVVQTFTGANNSAPTTVDNLTASASYAETGAFTTATAILAATFTFTYAARSYSSVSNSGTITSTNTPLAWSTVLTALGGFRVGIVYHQITSASGGRVRLNFSGSATGSTIRSLIIPEYSEPEPPAPVNTVTYFDGTIERTFEPRYFDGTTEYGFYYPDGRTGDPAHTLSYFDGTTEYPITVTGPEDSLVDGMTYTAHGDSSGAVQTSGGVDYTSTQTWPHQLAGLLGTTCTNRHVSSSTATDVFERLNRSDESRRWVPGAFDFVTFFVGGNDLVHTHDAAGGPRGFKNAVKAISGLVRMGSRVLASTGSTTGTWSNGSNGSGGVRQTSSTGATLTMSFTGTDAMLIVLAPRTGNGATFTVTVDGGTPIADTTQDSGAAAVLSGSWAPVPIFMRGLANTSHTVVITRTGGSGALVVDSIAVLAAEVDWPYVLFGPVIDAGDDVWELAGDPPYPTSSTVAAFRQLQREALIEADTKRQAVMIADHWQRAIFRNLTGIVISDGYHWNLAGQILAGKTAHADALRAFPA